MSTKQTGDISESKFLARCIELGYSVLIPFGDRNRYDFVISKDGKNFDRIQVKTGMYKNGVLRAKLYSTYYRLDKQLMRAYTSDEIDYFAICSSDLNKVYLVPIKEAPKKELSLRIEDTKNRQKKHIRWAKNYEF